MQRVPVYMHEGFPVAVTHRCRRWWTLTKGRASLENDADILKSVVIGNVFNLMKKIMTQKLH